MAKTKIIIHDDNLQQACFYLQKQFDARSWWPRAQPRLSNHEFDLMNGSAGALNVWCERWLDLGQLHKLERALKTM